MATGPIDPNSTAFTGGPVNVQPTDSPIGATLTPPAPVAPNILGATNNYTPNIAAQPAAPPSTGPSRTVRIIQGMLWGMSGLEQGRGRGNFVEGLSQGLRGYTANAQQEFENHVRQQQLQFESIKAADSHILATKQGQEADAATAEHKVSLMNQMQAANEWADEHGQPRPFTFVANNTQDMHAGAVGTLPILANANGGKIPAVTITQIPATDKDPNHSVNIYTATPQDVKSNPNAMADAINTMRQVQAGSTPLTPLTPQDILVQGGLRVKGNAAAGAAQMWQDAQQFLLGVPNITGDEAKDNATAAGLQMQLDRYQQNSQADAGTVKLLQTQLDTYKSGIENSRTLASQAKAKTATEQIPAEVAKTKAIEEAQRPFKEAQARFEQALKDGNPADAGALLAQGLVAPSQIISSRQPAFAEQAFKAANDYSMKTTGKPFNAQAQEGYFKAAEASPNVAFFGSAKSLTDQGGTLDQLIAAGGKVSQSEFDLLNKTVNWASLHTGSPGISGYGSTALGVADDYAKVMGGGAGSDTSRQMVLDSINPNRSPEQRQASVDAMRQAVDSQMNGRIGTNSVMKAMYGSQMLVHVTGKSGADYIFRNQQQADAFKKSQGIQ